MSKKSKKGKKAKKKNFLDEFETLNFEQQILENNRQLARLQTRNKELEAEAEKLREKFNQLEENKADLAAYLQVTVQQKTAEAAELQERLRALEKQRKKEQQEFRKKEETMEQEFKIMENNLTAEIKLAAGKLNALEDYRLARIDLMDKFEKQEKEMAEQEVRHRETLYETEKKLIVGKARMQNELETRLNELSESFRKAMDLRLADATKRAVRENIALRREVNNLLSLCSDLDARVADYKDRERFYRLDAILYEAESRIALEKVMKQTRTIEKLATEHKLMTEAIGEAHRAEGYAERSTEAVEEAKRICTESEEKSRILEQNIERERINRDDTIREVRDNCREIERLTLILSRAKSAVKDALRMYTLFQYGETGDDEGVEEHGSSCFIDVREKLLRTLLDILASYEPTVTDYEETTEFESEPVENLYEFGNLGLIPMLEDGTEAIAGPSGIISHSKSYLDEGEENEKESTELRSLSHSACSCD